MRTERNKDDSYNVWMTREEYQVLPRSTDDWEHEIARRLRGDCGLRRAEVLDEGTDQHGMSRNAAITYFIVERLSD